MRENKAFKLLLMVAVTLVLVSKTVNGDGGLMEKKTKKLHHKNAYVAMMYMGTPRDYEFYIATRVMLRYLRNLKAEADVVVIASLDVPLQWVQTLEKEDGAVVVRVKNMNNPYRTQGNFDSRFKLTLNKLYAWTLVQYERVVMLDSDNLFLQNTDELFQCGQFCAAFINPCIFHTGLFVLEPSMMVFKDMVNELERGMENRDGADQGFLTGYFGDLLDRPLFHQPANGTKLQGSYRLPLSYQMDASYFYLQLRWSIPCGPNSVVTFPSVPWLKPWYWWSWPVLPLGLWWHDQRLKTIGISILAVPPVPATQNDTVDQEHFDETFEKVSAAPDEYEKKNKRISKGKKGGKKIVDPFAKKDWYDIKAPSLFTTRNVGKTLVSGTQGTKSSFAQAVVMIANVCVMLFVIIAGGYIRFKSGWPSI